MNELLLILPILSVSSIFYHSFSFLEFSAKYVKQMYISDLMDLVFWDNNSFCVSLNPSFQTLFDSQVRARIPFRVK